MDRPELAGIWDTFHGAADPSLQSEYEKNQKEICQRRESISKNEQQKTKSTCTQRKYAAAEKRRAESAPVRDMPTLPKKTLSSSKKSADTPKVAQKETRTGSPTKSAGKKNDQAKSSSSNEDGHADRVDVHESMRSL